MNESDCLQCSSLIGTNLITINSKNKFLRLCILNSIECSFRAASPRRRQFLSPYFSIIFKFNALRKIYVRMAKEINGELYCDVLVFLLNFSVVCLWARTQGAVWEAVNLNDNGNRSQIALRRQCICCVYMCTTSFCLHAFSLITVPLSLVSRPKKNIKRVAHQIFI